MLKLDLAAYQHYWSKGWVAVEGVFPHTVVERVAELAVTVSTTQLGSGDPYVVDVSKDGSHRAPRKIDDPFLLDPAFREFVVDAKLLGLLEAITGHRPLLLKDQIFLKPPSIGSAKPYHQDNYYFRLQPKDHVITAWIALDDVDEENGCLRYIEGSHRGSILPHEPVPNEPYNLAPSKELIDLTRQTLVPVGKGGVVFHHVNTLHTSHRNRSDRWRRAHATHWISREVTDMDANDGSLKDATFLRPECAAWFRG